MSCTPDAPLADVVDRLRFSSCNPDLKIIIGGSAVDHDPKLAAASRADAYIPTLAKALTWADDLKVSLTNRLVPAQPVKARVSTPDYRRRQPLGAELAAFV